MRRLFAIIALTLAIFTVQAQNLSEEFFTSPKSHPRLILKDGDVAALLQTPPISTAGFQLMEELAVEVKIAYEKLSAIAASTGTEIDSTICTTGGQAKNPDWLQYKSQIVGAAFSITACADAELVGNAVLAYCGLGKFNSIQEGARTLVQIHKVFESPER